MAVANVSLFLVKNLTSVSILSAGGNGTHTIRPLNPCPAAGNVTEPYNADQIRSAFTVTYVVYPILLIICTLGNIINLTVLGREKPIGPTNVYMCTVAVSDLFAVWLYLPMYVMNLTPKARRPALHVSYDAYEGLRVWGQETAFQVGDWTLIVFSLVRLLAVIRPFNFRWLQTVRTARISACVLLCLAGLFTLSNIVNYYYLWYRNLDDRQRPAWLQTWYWVLQQPAEVIMTIFKVFALFLINLITMLAIMRQQKSDIGKLRGGQRSNSDRKYRNSNILLMCCVAIYLVTQFPWMVMNILRYYDTCHRYAPRSVQRFASPFLTMCLLTNYSVNFIMYVTFSKRFRAQFLQIFAPACCKSFVKGTLGAYNSHRRSTAYSRSSESEAVDQPKALELSTSAKRSTASGKKSNPVK